MAELDIKTFEIVLMFLARCQGVDPDHLGQVKMAQRDFWYLIAFCKSDLQGVDAMSLANKRVEEER